LDSQEDAEFGS
jgi:hypothetical protein